MFDLLIRNASVVDGTGRPPFQADVGIAGQHIAAVGRLPAGASARQTIDAAGLTLMPGFVDLHTHYDGQASWDSLLAPSCYQGVTSVVFGNCGVGFAPARADKHEWLINLLEGVEDIPGTALAEGLSWDWETLPDYLNALGRRAYALDVGAQVPHAALRAYVMGDRGADSLAHPTAEEIATMARLTAEAIEAGALGFSTSRTVVHRTRAGESIGTLRAPEAELVAIATAIGATGKGVLQLISDAYLTADDSFAAAELDLVEKMARASRRPLSVTVQQTPNAPHRWRMIYDRIEQMRSQGLQVVAQVAVRAVGGILGLRTTANPFMATPTWQALSALPPEQRIARMREPAVRAQILQEHKMPVEGPFGETVARSFQHMFRMADPVDYEPDPSASLRAMADQAGIDPAAFAYDVLLEQEGGRLIYFPALNYVSGDLSAVHAMLSADYALFGLSDGGAHCGAICDASFTTTAIGIWSKGIKNGQSFPLETMVHGYTQRNARHVGWHDRGVIAPGYLADLNLVALDELALPPPEVVYDLPAHGMRLMQKARGYRATIKRGAITFHDGEPTGRLPGKLVRGPQAEPAADVARAAA